MIPFGRWWPDVATKPNVEAMVSARGCLPDETGYKPLPDLASSTDAIPGDVVGAGVFYDDQAQNYAFAGDDTGLYLLASDNETWTDVSRSGAAYNGGNGERWIFRNFGNLVLATTQTEPIQKFLLGTSSRFEALGGLPPQSRYMAIVRGFVVVGGILNSEREVAWSGLEKPETWTAGTDSSGAQVMPDGGPVRGLLGGETGYVFQSEQIRRMTFSPGSGLVFSFDRVEGGRGLAAPHSLVEVGSSAYFLGPDGFYRFSTVSGQTEPIGIGKWADTVRNDIKAGTELLVHGEVDPVNRRIMWAYIAKDSQSLVPNRVVFWDWSLDEATFDDIEVTAFTQWLLAGSTLDDITENVDTLPYSLDHPIWAGGAPLLGAFSTDRKLSFFAGQNRAAEWVTNDGARPKRRTLVEAIRPEIDAQAVTAAVATREARNKPITWPVDEAMETHGEIPAHRSGNLARLRLRVPAGEDWTQYSGHDVDVSDHGVW